MIRQANAADIDAIEEIYDNIHAAEERGELCIGWARGVYPVRGTAEAALCRGDLFVFDDAGVVKAAGIINKTQVDVYEGAPWKYAAEPDEVCVLHTLTVEPGCAGGGIGTKFVAFYEEYAASHGCTVLRMDTNAKNTAARRLYARLGYREAGIVPCVFNGLEGVNLVLLEKKI